MKNYIKLILLIGIVFLITCGNDRVACTEEAKLCPDGSSVGRVLPDCEFEKCPDTTVVNEKCDDSNRKYVAKSQEECERVQILCEHLSEPFYDECGCGCIAKEVNNFCKEEQRNADVCIEIYQPVCGWSDSEKIQCIRYPCANNYQNSCFACMNEDVLYWTKGECPL